MSADLKPMTDEIAKNLESAVNSSSVTHLYANGFQIAMSNADILLILQVSGVNVATLNMSYTLGKTLKERLDAVISHIESASGQPIMTTDRIDKYMQDQHSSIVSRDEGNTVHG